MKIAVNTQPLLSPLTGVGNYTYNIAKRLASFEAPNDYTYFYGFFSDRLFIHKDNGIARDVDEPHDIVRNIDRWFTRMGSVKESLKRVPVLRTVLRHSKSALYKHMTKKWKFDLYFEPNFIPIDIRAPRVVATVHDFAFYHHPEWLPGYRAGYFKKNFFEKIKRADAVVFVSDFIRREAEGILDIPTEKFHTIHNGYNEENFRLHNPEELDAVRSKFNLPENFVLSVSTLEPRKNLERLITAYLGLDPGLRREVPLILAGYDGWKNESIRALIRKGGESIRYLGYLNEADLACLYNLATLLAFPSLYEGFGLPVLEAMACGTPVVTSNISSMPEVGGDAARYVDPTDIDDISRGISEVLSDEGLSNRMSAAGIERARDFSWERSAREHLAIFEKVRVQ